MFPDGSSLNARGHAGADQSGYAGYNDQVNNHYLRIFGSAIMMSLISGGMSYAVDSLDASGGDSDTPVCSRKWARPWPRSLGKASLRLLEKNISIAPTLEIRPGYVFNVVITKDLVFERPYRAWR